jgi:vitamin B12 transporter
MRRSSTRKKTFALVTILALPAPAAFAQTGTTTPIILPQIVISATALPALATHIGSSVTVITEEEIQRSQKRTVGELLETVPGLNIAQTGPSGPSSVFMRGANSNHVKVLIDGIEVNDPSSPNRAFDFSTMTSFDLERIEVLRGPQSGLYGADALGGVISITTKKGSGPTRINAMAEGGSFKTFNQAAQISGGTDRAHYAFTASHMRVGGIPVTPLELLPPGQPRNNDSHENWTYHGKFGADLTENFSVNFVGRYTDIDARFTEDSGWPSVPRPDQSKSTGRYFHGLSEATWRMLDGRLNHRAGIAYTDTARRSLTPGSSWSPFDGRHTKYFWKADAKLAPNHTLVLGAEHSEESARTAAISASTNSSGAYAELQSGFVDRLFVTANIRYDDHKTFGGYSTWRVASAFLIPETQTRLKASYGTAYYAPSLNQLHDPNYGNPALNPEESRGYDYGFEQSMFDDRMSFGATWFHNDIRNLITFAPVAPYPFININKAETHGVEAFIAAKLTDQLAMRLDYTRTVAKDGTTGDMLLRRPKHKTSLSAVWTPNDVFSFTVTALWVSGWYDYDRPGLAFPAFKTSGHTVVNLAADYKLNERTTLFGRIDNLSDERYEVPIGWLRPGFSVYAGIRVTN